MCGVRSVMEMSFSSETNNTQKLELETLLDIIHHLFVSLSSRLVSCRTCFVHTYPLVMTPHRIHFTPTHHHAYTPNHSIPFYAFIVMPPSFFCQHLLHIHIHVCPHLVRPLSSPSFLHPFSFHPSTDPSIHPSTQPHSLHRFLFLSVA